jgi:hypothetical protein
VSPWPPTVCSSETRADKVAQEAQHLLSKHEALVQLKKKNWTYVAAIFYKEIRRDK